MLCQLPKHARFQNQSSAFVINCKRNLKFSLMENLKLSLMEICWEGGAFIPLTCWRRSWASKVPLFFDKFLSKLNEVHGGLSMSTRGLWCLTRSTTRFCVVTSRRSNPVSRSMLKKRCPLMSPKNRYNPWGAVDLHEGMFSIKPAGTFLVLLFLRV